MLSLCFYSLEELLIFKLRRTLGVTPKMLVLLLRLAVCFVLDPRINGLGTNPRIQTVFAAKQLLTVQLMGSHCSVPTVFVIVVAINLIGKKWTPRPNPRIPFLSSFPNFYSLLLL